MALNFKTIPISFGSFLEHKLDDLYQTIYSELDIVLSYICGIPSVTEIPHMFFYLCSEKYENFIFAITLYQSLELIEYLNLAQTKTELVITFESIESQMKTLEDQFRAFYTKEQYPKAPTNSIRKIVLTHLQEAADTLEPTLAFSNAINKDVKDFNQSYTAYLADKNQEHLTKTNLSNYQNSLIQSKHNITTFFIALRPEDQIMLSSYYENLINNLNTAIIDVSNAESSSLQRSKKRACLPFSLNTEERFAYFQSIILPSNPKLDIHLPLSISR